MGETYLSEVPEEYLPLHYTTPYSLTQEESRILLQKHQIFTQLTQKFPLILGTQASRTDRALLTPDPALTYGETDFLSLGEIFYTIKNRYPPIPEGPFYDLGSGLGKAVVGAALLGSFKHCIGVELLPSLHSLSQDLERTYNALFSEEVVRNPELWTSPPALQFLCQDLSQFNFSDAGFLFVASTCFDRGLLRKIGSAQVSPGTLAVSFTSELGGEDWEILETMGKTMSWGETTVYVQRRRTH